MDRGAVEKSVVIGVFVAVAAVFALATLARSTLPMSDTGWVFQAIRLSRRSASIPDLEGLPYGLRLLPPLSLSAWLAYLAVADIRRGEVSNWVTIPLLLAVALVRLLMGRWVLAALLVLVVIAGSWPRFQYLSLALTLTCIGPAFQQGLEVAAAVWIASLLMWCLNALGGADVKALMILTGVFPDIRFVHILLPVWLLFSLVYPLIRHRDAPFQAIQQAGAHVMEGRLATSVVMADGAPALPAIAVAGIAYLWIW